MVAVATIAAVVGSSGVPESNFIDALPYDLGAKSGASGLGSVGLALRRWPVGSVDTARALRWRTRPRPHRASCPVQNR